MRIVALADLHCQTPDLPDGDVLTISGDLTWRGTLPEMAQVATWIRAQPHKHKVIIAGNHDFCLEDKHRVQQAELMLGGNGIVYLRDQGITLDGKTFYGSPWQPYFHNWAFNVHRGSLSYYWDKIPANLDVLLVHGPPFGYGDRLHNGDRVGCEEMVDALYSKVPKHVFYGHIHEDVGQWTMNEGETKLYNCSIGPDWARSKPGQPVVVDI
jgi:Icc-related predicted phosphoesterase